MNSRTNGSGCPTCSGRRANPGVTDLATVNPGLAAQWHPTKNGTLTPAMVTRGSNRKAWWRCPDGHEWQARVRNRTNGSGCPTCSGRRVNPGLTDLATASPDLAAQWHPTKNGDLTPAMVTRGSKRKVWWLCSDGHAWQTRVSNRTNGTGCPTCSGRQVNPGVTDLAIASPDVAAQWHPTRNGDLTPAMVTRGSKRKAWWLCPNGHEWQATIGSRSNGAGCSQCRRDRTHRPA